MKNIIPHKIVISFNVDGTFDNGILLYQKQEESGLVLNKYHSISIKNTVNKPIMNGIINKAIKFAKKSEGMNV